MSIANFHNLLKDFGSNVGLTDLKPNDDGLCSLRFDDRVTIDLECNEQSETLVFSTIVGTLLPYQIEKMYSKLLEANLFWSGTGDATLGVDPATLRVFLCYQERIQEMAFLRFQELLKNFSDVALSWNKSLLEDENTDSQAATTVSSSNETSAPFLGSVATYA